MTCTHLDTIHPEVEPDTLDGCSDCPDRGPPLVPAYGAELNQVWTNLIDDAADAMGGSGVLKHRAAWSSLSQAVLRHLQPGPPSRRIVVDVDRVVSFTASDDNACVHASVSRPVLPSSPGCLECSRTGDTWVHLRLCTSCGHVGCCDSSPNRHAAAHAAVDDPPVLAFAEPGEDWGWCCLDERTLTP